MNEFQKIAALLAHLDDTAREQVLAQLPKAHRSQLEALPDQATSIPDAELTDLVREYQTHLVQMNSPTKSSASATNESGTGIPACYLSSPSISLASSQRPDESASFETEIPPNPHRLNLSCSAASLVELLEEETARFASAVIAHLPEAQSAELFDSLPVERRERVMTLLADQRELTIPVVRELECYLLEKQAATTKATSHGAHVLAKLMSPPETSSEVVEGQVEKAEYSLLEKLRRQMTRRSSD